MSTEKQLHGDSLRRQLALSQDYALANDLELVESYKDIGVSGFRGKNVEQGMLGVFLEALRNKEIPPDSVLLIESLDRLSRDKVTTALMQFLEILKAGVEIVTLADNQRYTKEGVDSQTHQIVMSLFVMARANDESETKSMRLKAAWKNKRDNASNKPVTSICPAWIRYSDTQQRFELIPERAAVVRKIFRMCADTCGVWGIAKLLNESKTPVFGTGKLWHRSYITKIIRNPASYGCFQPGQRENGKQIPVGDPIRDYYPAVVSEADFQRANASVFRRSSQDRGRKGRGFSNIFSGLTYCGKCGSRVILRNRGKSSKGGKYLVCSNQAHRNGCTMSEWKHDDLLRVLVTHLQEVDFFDLDGSATSKRTEIDSDISTKQAEQKQLESQQVNLIELYAKTEAEQLRNQILPRITSTVQYIEELKEAIHRLTTERAMLDDARRPVDTKALISTMTKVVDDDEDYFNRSKMNQLLAKTIEKIDLHDDFVFQPWDYDENSEEVITYRAGASKRKYLSLDELVDRPTFKEHCRNFSRKISVRYRFGVIRVVDFGLNWSWLNDWHWKLEQQATSSAM